MAKKNEAEVQMDRRDNDRRDEDRRQSDQPVAGERRSESRRKVQRRRQIDPTTCERDYTNDEIEFMQALDEYKRRNGRMFPTCSEILEVIRDLGYCRVDEDGFVEVVSDVQGETFGTDEDAVKEDVELVEEV